MRFMRNPNRLPVDYQRSGFTLIELLVTLVVLLMVTAATIPLMLGAVEGRRVREASRAVSAFISGAKTRAIETGRPVGVIFQRFTPAGAATPLNFAINLSYVEVPTPYSGDSTASVATVTGGTITFLGVNAATPTPDSGWQNLVRAGDLIKFNYQGRTYMILGPSGATAGMVLTSSNAPSSTPWLLGAIDSYLALSPTALANLNLSNVPYQIIRQPAISGATPLQLPEGTVIDLSNSGMASSSGTGVFSGVAPFLSPVVTFTPGGTVEFLYDGPSVQHPTGPIYLLIGRREGMADVNTGGLANNPLNLFDPNNLWVTVGVQTGLVASSENLVANPASSTTLIGARSIAQQSQTMGGR